MKRKWIFPAVIVSVIFCVFCSALVVYILCMRLGLDDAGSASTSAVTDSRMDDLEEENEALRSSILFLENRENLIPAVLPDTVIMDVEKYAQTHPASCESASAYAVMDYFGVDFSEDSIIDEIGADLSSRYFDNNGDLHWGNPQETFVGDIDGQNVYVDGYGVYNQPIAEVLKAHGFAASISQTGWEVDNLLEYIRRGYPAIVWISNDYQSKEVGTMIALDGVENPWIWGEHAVVLRGVDSDEIYIMDVGDGSYYTVSYSKFETGFSNLNNMAIVVIPGDV